MCVGVYRIGHVIGFEMRYVHTELIVILLSGRANIAYAVNILKRGESSIALVHRPNYDGTAICSMTDPR